MQCGECQRWRKLRPPKAAPVSWSTRYGTCRWPGTKPAPYWKAVHPTGDILVADCHGSNCPAFKQRSAQ